MKKEIIITVISTCLGFVSGYLLHIFTKEQPHLLLAINPHYEHFAEDRIIQFLNLKSDGNDVAKRVRLVVQSMKGRMYEHIIVAKPSLLEEAKIDTNSYGDLTFNFGDLQPSTQIIIKLSYKRPPLRHLDVNAFSDKITAKKVIPESNLETMGDQLILLKLD